MSDDLEMSVSTSNQATTWRRGLCDVLVLTAMTALMSSLAYAQEEVDIGTVDNEGFDLIVEWFQSFVNFMAGPAGIAVVVVSLVVAVATWVFAPREGLLGPVMRVAVGALVILNIGTWITTWGFGG